MNNQFDEWFKKLKTSIASYTYYINYSKVIDNVKKYSTEIGYLNNLIGSQNIKEEFKNIISEHPETLNFIPLLLATRETKLFVLDKNTSYIYDFKNKNYSIEQYETFMEETGLFDLLQNHLINNLTDYMIGVETGLDSNGRKNRTGTQMENLVEKYIQDAGFIKGETYYKEMNLSSIENKWKIDLSSLSNKGKTEKRFDFVIKTENNIYAIETNFYGSGGSKLNETARSYKMLATEAKNINGFAFMWITDGIGWKTAKNNLKETFEVMNHLYCIDDLENKILEKLQ